MAAESFGGRIDSIRVLDELGVPAPQLPVLVDGTVVTTDSDGYALLPLVGATYDVTLLAGGYVYAYQGMTTRAPVVRIPYGRLGDGDEHGVNITVHTAGLPDNQYAYVVESVSGAGVGDQSVGFNGSEGEYWSTLAWAGPQPALVTVEAYLFDYEPPGFATEHFTGYAKLQQSLSDGDDIDWTPQFEAPPFGEATLHVSINMPEGQSVFQSVASIDMGGLARWVSAGQDAPGSSTFVVPDLPGATFSVNLDSYGNNGNASASAFGLTAGATVEVDMPEAPEALAPADGASVAKDTEFSWTVPQGAVRYMYAWGDSPSSPTMVVASASSVVRLPDASALGVTLTPGTTLTWHGDFDLGPASLDEFAARRARVRGWGASATREVIVAP